MIRARELLPCQPENELDLLDLTHQRLDADQLRIKSDYHVAENAVGLGRQHTTQRKQPALQLTSRRLSSRLIDAADLDVGAAGQRRRPPRSTQETCDPSPDRLVC